MTVLSDLFPATSGIWLILGTIFATVVLGVLGLAGLVQKNGRSRDRLAAAPSQAEAVSVRLGGGRLAKFLRPIEAHVLPQDANQLSSVRRRLIQAGFLDPKAVTVYYAARVLMAAGLPLAFLFLLPFIPSPRIANNAAAVASALLLLGYMAPSFAVTHRIQKRRETIRNAFPDALDLLLVCVEAGLGLDAAINRVGEELTAAHPLLAEQFNLLGLEMRAGRSREDALRNLAERIGLDEVSAFVTLLIQSDRLGTSLGEALRVYAHDMRLTRLMRAEERAHQLPVKMAIPLVLFLLPSLLIVVMLPAIIQVVRNLFPAMGD